MVDKPLGKYSKQELVDLVNQLQQQAIHPSVERDIDTEGSYVEGTARIEGGGDWVGGSKGLSGVEISQIIETLLKHFPESILQPTQLDSTLDQIIRFHESLYEWKELHNHLDVISNAFSPFAKQIERSEVTRKIPETREILNYWYPVSERIGSFLLWAQSVHHIGLRYEVLDDKSMLGERWAVRISKLRNDIEEHLGLGKTKYGSSSRSGAPKGLQRLLFRLFGLEILWLRELGELSRVFEHAATEQMHHADKKLREAATELYNLSQRTLLRSQTPGANHDE